ncbi:hypothetical protein CC78DRAFT_534336 [Lojkania enalia]|uniref:Uncharacterized protein n=1 Tax=Lojkania enalia TaxID=147567 RepID=A0A9P4N2Y3_9PLEO|nr:hypothetical protein CC78DRAFT_534336 [Didymosphaeria enalia]
MADKTRSTTTEPSPTNWILRLKNGKTTVFLHINPLQTFTSIKTHLYHALTEAPLKDAETGREVPLPPSPADIQLGRPVNINNAKEGFVLGEWEYRNSSDLEEADVKGKGKGRLKKRSNELVDPDVKDCPKGAGLRDGAVLAFRWREDGDEDMRDGEEDMWGVKIPSYEDSYGVENEGDVGGRREFEG